jgi:hypothetical protein
VSLRKLNKEVADMIGRAFENMPSSFGTSVCVLELRGVSTTANSDSVSASREPHFMLELISLVAEEDVKEALECPQI